jgi:mannose-6-phosphate isomerase-like protein (cupin superfamily)
MKIRRMEDVPKLLPPKHYDLESQPIVDDTLGIKGLRISFGRMQSSGRADPHVHEHADQLFIVLKGEMVMKTEQEEVRLKEGDVAYIPPGEVHGNWNGRDGETQYLVITRDSNT